MDATQPQTDRELLLKLNGNVEALSKSIDHFSDTLQYLEEKKLGSFDQRLSLLEDWRLQISGGVKVMIALWTIMAGLGIFAGIKYFFR